MNILSFSNFDSYAPVLEPEVQAAFSGGIPPENPPRDIAMDEVNRRLEFLIERSDELLKSHAAARQLVFWRSVIILGVAAGLILQNHLQYTTLGWVKLITMNIASILSFNLVLPTTLVPPGIDWPKFKASPERSYTGALGELLEDKGRAVAYNTKNAKAQSQLFWLSLVSLAAAIVLLDF